MSEMTRREWSKMALGGVAGVVEHVHLHPRPVAVVTLRNRTLSPVAQLFIDCARKLTKSLDRVSK